MRPPSAKVLEAKWKGRPWYHKPSGTRGEPRHSQDDLNLRLRRSLSWLGRAEREYEAQDFDAAFILHWVAFNAAYGRLGSSPNEETRDWRDRQDYFDRVVEFVDSDRVIYDTIWADLLDPIRKMLENQFVYEPYWKFRNGVVRHRNWKKQLGTARDDAEEAIKGVRTKDVLLELFHRLYTLRNQSASWRCDLE